MAKYLVTLNPIGSFFFGDEKTFSFEEEYKKNSKLKNNIIKSRLFPQQTSILGMLRKEILIKENLISDNWDYKDEKKKKRIQECIGANSFSIEGDKQEFGYIKKVSPVFIREKTKSEYKYLMKIPKDHLVRNTTQNKANEEKKEYEKKRGEEENKPYKVEYVPLKFFDKNSCKIRCSYGEKDESGRRIALPSNFVSKDGISEEFVLSDYQSGDGKKKSYVREKSSIFIKESNTGIKLDEKCITKDESLFRVVRYKFNNSEDSQKEFVFTVEIDDVIDFDGYINIVNLGGENSYFSIKFEKSNIDIKKEFENIQSNTGGDYKKIILISDTYLSEEAYKNLCEYSISNTVTFRNIKTTVSSKHYYNKIKKIKEKFYFFERGSVLYTTSEKYEELVNAIKDEKLQNIGYNEFV